MPVAVLQAQMSSNEFTEWLAYYRLEPFGEERADLRMAILAALIANVNSDGKKKYSPEEFMPVFDQEQEQKIKQGKIVKQLLQFAGKTNGKLG